MLGLVFARFSAPFKRANSIQFSSLCTIGRHSSGYWALTFRWGRGCWRRAVGSSRNSNCNLWQGADRGGHERLVQ
jgi:hypothetical protein